MPLELWNTSFSPPCRSVLLTAKALNVDLELKEVNMMNGEHMEPDFLNINPQHCLPTLVDGDFVLWESRAICGYLVSQYGDDDSFYPSDAKTRALVDRLLYFDMGTLYHRFTKYVMPVMFKGQTPDQDQLNSVQEALGWLDGWLKGHEWAVGDTITIADHCLASTLATIEACGVNLETHTHLMEWLERCKNDMPGYTEVNVPGAEMFGNIFNKSGGH
ncbi:hypothetical protein Pmani_037524 [Petrolisthes manimaculis]|uniref:Uncharacterized protein n=1 Tax=Petrolisthes manimaculis TaxID=1843537 RepID=A0AAE1NG63_9EUCA|nr:hypothetical protein Pmani_037524 [Petrolisthes manimaculis]